MLEMDFVKREDQNAGEENYKAYMDSLQKHQLDTDFQHTSISMEQLHQAMQSSLNPSSIIHNFQLPLSPRQMSTLMLKTNHLSRNLNFNEIPTHITRDDLVMNELHQNLRHDEMLTQNFCRNLDISLVRNMNELELQGNLTQNVVGANEQDISRNLDLRLNEASLSQTRSDLPQNLSQELVMAHLNRQNLEHEMLAQDDQRRAPIVMPDGQILDQVLAQRLSLNLDRLDQNLAQRLSQNLDRLDQRLMNPNIALHERQVEQNEHLLPMPFQIKAEQEDDGYFYDNINQGINNVTEINGQVQAEQTQPQTNIHGDSQIYSMYNNHINVPALNSLDMYSRTQNYMQNYTSRDNPQNLVVHKQFHLPYSEEDPKKIKEDEKKIEEPKENLKPTDQNKMYYDYSQTSEENENDSSAQNKLSSGELSMNIKGEYVCYKCNEVFPSKRGLKQHSKVCTEDGENQSERIGKFGCSQCAYRCQSPAILKIHERTHSGEKPFSCTFCDYKSGQKNNVAKHILVHMKEKPFRCQYCDYRCAQKNNLVVHERTHTGYKPFACPYCDYRTVQKPNLVKHMYLHTDQKPFSCDMCSYRCVQKTNLTKHKQRHLNEKEGDKIEVKSQVKPYRPRQKSVKCSQCSYRCVQKSSMEKHVQYKHVGTAPDCEQVSGLISEESIQNLSVKKQLYECQEKILDSVQVQP